MNIKENDQIPNSEVFVMENGDPVKKNTQELLLCWQPWDRQNKALPKEICSGTTKIREKNAQVDTS